MQIFNLIDGVNDDEYEICERCDGTGAIDAPFSGSDPSCPECDGEGIKYLGY